MSSPKKSENLPPVTTSLKNLDISDRSLGKGGFGSVFIGKLGEKQVAAKKLSQSEKEFDNLTREASKLKRLRYGKHIAYMYSIIMKDEGLFMVMEYCERGDLQNYLRRNKESVTYEQRILFCRGILLGLLYCHSMNVFHGDIKCSNVILGENLEPKLTDFGLSMTVENIEGYCKMYEGSIHWAAPELFSMREDNNFEEFKANPYPTDVYSLGATFCQVSFYGTTEFVDSDNIETDISLGLVSPTSKDGFLEEIVDGCCQFERNERMSLDKCLTALDIIAEKQLPILNIDDEWLKVQQDIKADSKLELPPSFILHRPKGNLVIGPSNLSLLEWLCIKNCKDAVEYMIQPHKSDEKRLKWLCNISTLCGSLDTAEVLRSKLVNKEFSCRKLSDLIDNSPQKFIEVLTRAGASFYSYNLLKSAIEKCYNIVVQTIIDSRDHFKNWAIHDAVKSGNAEAVEILVDAGVDLERKDYRTGNTPLIIAIDTENIEIVKIILKSGVDVHNVSSYTRSGLEVEIPHGPLYLAALKDNREIIKFLIDAGATVDITSDEWRSLSQSLEQQGNISMARFIGNNISKKSSPTESNSLCAAIRDKQSDYVQAFIDNKTNVDEVGLDEYAPLHWAVVVGDEEIVSILIKAGADLDIRTSSKKPNLQPGSSSDYFSECTPLHIAVAKGYLSIAKLLIESGADFSAKNGLQRTIMKAAAVQNRKLLEEIIRKYAPINTISIRRAMKSIGLENIKLIINRQLVNTEILSECLCIAASSGKSDLVKYLLECKANVNKRCGGKTPLEWAIFGGNIKAMEILINAGAYINAKNKHQETLLFQCVWESHTEMVQLLIDKGANVNIRNAFGYQPIRYAKDREIADILIEAGAVIDAKGDDGKALLFQYLSESQVDMLQFLVDKGADVNTKDGDGNTPIHLAENREIAEILIAHDADINAKNRNGVAPLILNAYKSNVEVMKSLVDRGANINIEDKYGNAPIHRTDNKEIMEILISGGADINAKGRYGKTPLIQSVRKANAEVMRFLINKGADVNIKDEDGNAPIHCTNNAEIMEALINAGADINAKDPHGRTPLIQNVYKPNAKVVKFLVDKGADVNVRDKDGKAPIQCTNNEEIIEILINAGAENDTCNEAEKILLIQSVKESNTGAVRLLVDKGIDINARDKDGYAPIHYVKDKEVAEILISHGADINAKKPDGGTPLFECVRDSSMEMVQFLVDKGADVHIRDAYENAPIRYVKDREILKFLIDAGADINVKNCFGETLLLFSVYESNTEMVQFLIDKGANINTENKYGKVPIHCTSNIRIMEILINAGADINAKDQEGTALLIRYVKGSNTKMVRFLIEKGADVNVKDEDGKTPIHCTSNGEIMVILINAGADINVKGQHGTACLIQNVKDSNIKMVQFLVNKGADVNAGDKDGKAPIHYAKDREVADILIKAGAVINAKDQHGITCLIQHVKESNAEMINYMIEKGADVNAGDKDGKTSIHYTDDGEIMKILIDAGADINAKNLYGETPLIKYIKKSNTEMMRFLVERGADVNAKDIYGNAPIHHTKDRRIVEALVNAGADINAKDRHGRTLLIESIRKSNKEMVQFLLDKKADVNAKDEYENASIHFVRDKKTAEILIAAGANINVKDRYEKGLFDILMEEQNRNLSNNQYERKDVCKLLEYLRGINRSKV